MTHSSDVDRPLTASDVRTSVGTGHGMVNHVVTYAAFRPTRPIGKGNKSSIERNAGHPYGQAPCGPDGRHGHGKAALSGVGLATTAWVAGWRSKTSRRTQRGHMRADIVATKTPDSNDSDETRGSQTGGDTCRTV